jgi:hypothetical protein
LSVEPRLGAVEDVISGDCYKNALRFFACPREILRPSGIRCKSSLAIGFTSIDVGPGSAIDHEVRLVRENRLPHEAAIGDVQIFVPVRKNLIAGMGTMLANS